jgi:hypothetical protein
VAARSLALRKSRVGPRRTDPVPVDIQSKGSKYKWIAVLALLFVMAQNDSGVRGSIINS